jgi:hypothetical protein
MAATMPRLLTTLAALATLTAPALAAPPDVGSDHTFLDPVFRGTIFCDTLKEVRTIAEAERPDDAYANFYLTTNERDEPICMAIAPTGRVVDVVPLGVMEKDGGNYNAWAIETEVNGTTVFALYLERFNLVNA